MLGGMPPRPARAHLASASAEDGPVPGRRERAKADKQARIVAAARALLLAKGYDAMTMAEVARDADVAIGTVFQYAATKPELLMLVVAREWGETAFGRTSSGAATTRPATGAEEAPMGATEAPMGAAEAAIREVLEPFARVARERPELSVAAAREVIFGAPGPHRDEVLALADRVEQAVAGVIEAAGGAARAGAAARLVVSGWLMELNRTRTGRAGRDDIDARLSELIAIAVRGARP